MEELEHCSSSVMSICRMSNVFCRLCGDVFTFTEMAAGHDAWFCWGWNWEPFAWLLCDGLRAFACVVVFTLVYTIKVETIENNSHLKWTTLTPHRWPHTTGPKMVDRRKQLFLKCFHSKPPTFLTIALLCTHRTHLLISYGITRTIMKSHHTRNLLSIVTWNHTYVCWEQ